MSRRKSDCKKGHQTEARLCASRRRVRRFAKTTVQYGSVLANRTEKHLRGAIKGHFESLSYTVARRMMRMAQAFNTTAWTRTFQRTFAAMTRQTMRAGSRAVGRALEPMVRKRRPPPGAGDWIPGVSMGQSGARRFRLYRPPGVRFGERLPLLVMLHGCGQDSKGFAVSTCMNRLAATERFLVLYPEQDRLANAQGCWNWFETRSGRAYGEAALIMKAIDQVCLLYSGDRARVAIAGMSAGASMAALIVARHPARFKALMMHSGVPPGTAHSAMSALGAMHGRRGTKALPANTATTTDPWPPLLVIHGVADPVVSVNNAHAAVKTWANAAGARAGKARSVQRGKRYPTTITDFKRSANTVATLIEVARAWAMRGAAGRRITRSATAKDPTRRE